MKRIKQISFFFFFAVVVIQFIRPARNHSGQAVETDLLKLYDVPDTVHTLLKNACYDCHSNNTSYPWYSNIQPIGWLLARDIENGKAKLNFADLASISPRRRASKLSDMQNRIKDGTMPLRAYQIMHPSARLTEDDKRILIDWMEKTKDVITLRR